MSICAALAATTFVSVAGACEIEEWRAVQSSSRYARIEGTTSCSSGQLLLELHDAASGKLLGKTTTFFAGGKFSAAVRIPGDLPDEVSIEYRVR